MLKTELEKTILDINDKLTNGIKVHVKDCRKSDALAYGLITGAAFMLSSIVIQEIRNACVRRKNKKWFEEQKKGR
jgi:hypothetical protein